MKFRLKKRCGSHIEVDKKGEPVEYKAGDIVESERDLVALFSNKFEALYSAEPVSSPDIPLPSIPAGELDVDVTDSFTDGKAVGVRIFEKANWYTVIDAEDGKSLSEKKLRKSQVEDLIAEYKVKLAVAKED